MKFAGLVSLFVAAGAVPLLADEPAKAPAPVPAPTETKPAAISPELVQQLSSVLPKYAPPAPVPVKPAAPDPDILQLPKVTITHKPRPRLNLTDEVMMTPKGFKERLAKENLSSLDRNLLNKFSLPSWLSGQSAEERAYEEYRLKEKEQLKSDVEHLASVAEVVDPDQAKTLRDAVNKP